MKELTLLISPQDHGYDVVLSQPGVPDLRYTWSADRLIEFAKALGRDWLKPSHRVIDIRADSYAFRIFRDPELGEFELEYGAERVVAKTHEELLLRMREFAGNASLELDTPHTLHVEAHDELPEASMPDITSSDH